MKKNSLKEKETGHWHDEENSWWNEFSELMAFQWKLTPGINKCVRSELESDYKGFLFKKNGRILDLGCGSGWLATEFAQMGMDTLGVDFSQEQIRIANEAKSSRKLSNVRFECHDVLKWDYTPYKEAFDSVFVNAFLHHLPLGEIEKVFTLISCVLKKEGRAYSYEPVYSQLKGGGKHFCVAINFFFNKAIGLSTFRLPTWFNLWLDVYKQALKKGYTGSTPNERPLDIDEMIRQLRRCGLEVSSVQPWHLYSLSFAMRSVSFKYPFNRIYQFFIRFLYQSDKILCSRFSWKNFSSRTQFLMCGVKISK